MRNKQNKAKDRSRSKSRTVKNNGMTGNNLINEFNEISSFLGMGIHLNKNNNISIKILNRLSDLLAGKVTYKFDSQSNLLIGFEDEEWLENKGALMLGMLVCYKVNLIELENHIPELNGLCEQLSSNFPITFSAYNELSQELGFDNYVDLKRDFPKFKYHCYYVALYLLHEGGVDVQDFTNTICKSNKF